MKGSTNGKKKTSMTLHGYGGYPYNINFSSGGKKLEEIIVNQKREFQRFGY